MVVENRFTIYNIIYKRTINRLITISTLEERPIFKINPR